MTACCVYKPALPANLNETGPDTVININHRLPIRFGVGYTGDFAGNLTGGLRTGTTFMGMARINLEFNTGEAGLWRGGQLFAMVSCTHGGMPSQDLIGDFQVASNIEAGNHLFVQELWFRQRFGSAEVTIGLQDLNATFVCNETGGSFLNSSFGIPSMITSNIPAPVFPLTTLGITAGWQVTGRLALGFAIHDGSPLSFESNPYNLRWRPSADHGVVTIARARYAIGPEKLSGCIELGGYYHTGLTEPDELTGTRSEVFDHNHGIYLIAEKTLHRGLNDRLISMFLQAAVSPRTINRQHYYLGWGVTCHGLFSANGRDEAGFGIAHAGFCNQIPASETTLELFYRYQLTPFLFIQPDIQYIIHPSGSDIPLPNAMVLFLRAAISIQH